MTDDVFATRGTLAAAIKPRETTEDHPVPVLWHTSEAYRRALAIAHAEQRAYIAREEAARDQRRTDHAA